MDSDSGTRWLVEAMVILGIKSWIRVGTVIPASQAQTRFRAVVHNARDLGHRGGEHTTGNVPVYFMELRWSKRDLVTKGVVEPQQSARATLFWGLPCVEGSTAPPFINPHI